MTHPEVPWENIIGMRHKIVYDDLGVDEDVWQVVTGLTSFSIHATNAGREFGTRDPGIGGLVATHRTAATRRLIAAGGYPCSSR